MNIKCLAKVFQKNSYFADQILRRFVRVVVVLIDSYSGLLDEMALLDLERLFRVLVPVVEAGWLTNVFSILIPMDVYDNSGGNQGYS